MTEKKIFSAGVSGLPCVPSPRRAFTVDPWGLSVKVRGGHMEAHSGSRWAYTFTAVESTVDPRLAKASNVTPKSLEEKKFKF